MKLEFSAGGIVFKREKGSVFVLMVQHGGYNHHWGFPKGHIGDMVKGESKEEAAIREVKEETGVEAKLLQPVTPIQYWYAMGAEKRKKTVYFFVMEYERGDFSDKDFEMQKVEWVLLEEALGRITYKSEKRAFVEAQQFIRSIK